MTTTVNRRMLKKTTTKKNEEEEVEMEKYKNVEIIIKKLHTLNR